MPEITLTIPTLLALLAVIAFALWSCHHGGIEIGSARGHKDGYSAGIGAEVRRSSHQSRLQRQEIEQLKHLRTIERSQNKAQLEAERETIEALHAVISTAYGLLWCSTTTNRHTHNARTTLMQAISKQQQAAGITKARNEGAGPAEGVIFTEDGPRFGQEQQA